jgi:hypothetical protein
MAPTVTNAAADSQAAAGAGKVAPNPVAAGDTAPTNVPPVGAAAAETGAGTGAPAAQTGPAPGPAPDATGYTVDTPAGTLKLPESLRPSSPSTAPAAGGGAAPPGGVGGAPPGGAASGAGAPASGSTPQLAGEWHEIYRPIRPGESPMRYGQEIHYGPEEDFINKAFPDNKGVQYARGAPGPDVDTAQSNIAGPAIEMKPISRYESWAGQKEAGFRAQAEFNWGYELPQIKFIFYDRETGMAVLGWFKD